MIMFHILHFNIRYQKWHRSGMQMSSEWNRPKLFTVLGIKLIHEYGMLLAHLLLASFNALSSVNNYTHNVVSY